jgi:hypothetical protein
MKVSNTKRRLLKASMKSNSYDIKRGGIVVIKNIKKSIQFCRERYRIQFRKCLAEI